MNLIPHEVVLQEGVDVLVHVEMRLPHPRLALVEHRGSATPEPYNFVDVSSNLVPLQAEPLDVLLLGGLPIGASIAHDGPFVMNTREEILRALAAEGRIAVAVWGTPDEVAFATPVPVMGEMLGVAPPVDGPGPFALGGEGALERLVGDAGFTSVVAGTTLAGTT
jgi:hypothetical protein